MVPAMSGFLGSGPRNQAIPGGRSSRTGSPAVGASGLPFTPSTLERAEQDGRGYSRSVDDGLACGRPFQDAAALLVDPEDEPDDAEAFAVDPDEPDPDDSPEDDDDAASLFFSPAPFDDEPSGAEPSGALAFSRLSVR
jgi:hypothetical protein